MSSLRNDTDRTGDGDNPFVVPVPDFPSNLTTPPNVPPSSDSAASGTIISDVPGDVFAIRRGFPFSITPLDSTVCCRCSCDLQAHLAKRRACPRGYEGISCHACGKCFIGACGAGDQAELSKITGEWTCSAACRSKLPTNVRPRLHDPYLQPEHISFVGSNAAHIMSQPSQSPEEAMMPADLYLPVQLPAYGIPSSLGERLQRRCNEVLSSVPFGTTINVLVRRVGSNGKPESVWLQGRLRAKYLVEFAGHTQTYNLALPHVQNGLWMQEFGVHLPSYFGLPPREELKFESRGMLRGIPEYAIFVGISANRVGSAAAAAFTVRQRHPQHNCLWHSAGDLADHDLSFKGEITFSRAYDGGTSAAMSVLALTAAVRYATKDILARSGPNSVAIVIEPSAFGAMRLLQQHRATKRDKQQQRKKRTRQLEQMMGALQSALSDLGERAYIYCTNFAHPATRAAQQQLRGLGALPPPVDPDMLELFDNYLYTKEENVIRRQQQNVDAVAAAMQTLGAAAMLHTADKVQSVADLADLLQRNKARAYCPSSAADSFAAQAHALLLAIRDADERSRAKTTALIALMMLPNMVLPQGGTSRQVEKRINSGKPYNLEFSAAHLERREETEVRARAPDAAAADSAVQQLRQAREKQHDDALRRQALARVIDSNFVAMLLHRRLAHGRQQLHVAHDDFENPFDRRAPAPASRPRPDAAAAAAAATGNNVDGEEGEEEDNDSGDSSSSDDDDPVNDAEIEVEINNLSDHDARARLDDIVNEEVQALEQIMAAEQKEHHRGKVRDSQTRICEQITRHVNNCAIRTARRLAENIVDHRIIADDGERLDVSFQEKFEMLRKKFREETNEELPDMRLDGISSIPKVAAFSSESVMEVVRRLPTQAAPCIDGWNAKLLRTVVSVLPGAAALLGELSASIVNCAFDDLGMDILRAGRAVAVPKDAVAGPGAGIRPISLSSFLLKFAGSCVYKASGADTVRLKNQYALNRANGTHTVAHLTRAEFEAGYAIFRGDCSGAFDNVRRIDVLRVLYSKDGVIQKFFGTKPRTAGATEDQEDLPGQEDGHHNNNNNSEENVGDKNNTEDAAAADGAAGEEEEEEQNRSNNSDSGGGDGADQVIPENLDHINPRIASIIRYFAAAYGDGNALAVFGPDGLVEFINMRDGVKQGDTFSSFFYCLVQDLVNDIISKKCPGARIRIYIDDITITCEPRHLWYVVEQTKLALEQFGAKFNMSKSFALVQRAHHDECAAYPYGTELTATQRRRARADAEREWRQHPDTVAHEFQEDFCKIVFGQKYERPPELQRQRAKPGQRKAEPIPRHELDKQRELESSLALQRLRFDHMLYATENRIRREENEDPFATNSEDALSATAEMRDNIKCEDDTFVVLGANISRSYKEYNERQTKRHVGFCDMLEPLPLHPQIKFTLVRISGFAKPRFYASVNPPEETRTALKAFDDRAGQFMQDMFKFDVIGKELFHAREALGVPEYSYENANRLFCESRNAAVLGVPLQDVELVTNPSIRQEAALHQQQQQQRQQQHQQATVDEDGADGNDQQQQQEENDDDNNVFTDTTTGPSAAFASARDFMGMSPEQQREHKYLRDQDEQEERDALRDHRAAQSAPGAALWMQYQARGHDVSLSPADFLFGMAIRCGVLPRDYVNPPRQCKCGKSIPSPLRLIQHAVNCQQCGQTPTQRHNQLRDSIGRVLIRYGFVIQKEPEFFAQHYEDYPAKERRPDLHVFLAQPLTTDFSIAQQHSDRPFVAGAHRAAEKIRQNTTAIARGGSTFVPFVAEAHGALDGSVQKFIGHVTQHLAPHRALEIRHEILIATANSLCLSRIKSVSSMAGQKSCYSYELNEDQDDADERLAGSALAGL